MSTAINKCEVCKKEFGVRPYRAKIAKYCSRRCSSMGRYHKMRELGYGLPVAGKSHLIGNTHRKGHRPTNAFLNGHTPWNAGLKGIHLSSKTEFQKGSVPNNKVSVGTITKRTDRNGTSRKYIKITEPNVWKAYSVFLWEKENGIVPNGYVVHHINKNALDDRIENLELLTRAEHLSVHRDDFVNVI